MESFANYLDKSSAITILVLVLLSGYFVASIWVFIYRYTALNETNIAEFSNLKKLYTGQSTTLEDDSVMFGFLSKVIAPNRAIYTAALHNIMKNATNGLTYLSVIASTSPFIGLFGTVVSILETFASLGDSKNGTSISFVAPALSEALVATAAGILVAIVAYSFHLLLKRKAYELHSTLNTQIEFILSQNESKKEQELKAKIEAQETKEREVQAQKEQEERDRLAQEEILRRTQEQEEKILKAKEEFELKVQEELERRIHEPQLQNDDKEENVK